MYLEEIIGDIELESDKYESKAILNREDVVGWLKTIAGFANASGGDSIELDIGLGDADDGATGCEVCGEKDEVLSRCCIF